MFYTAPYPNTSSPDANRDPTPDPNPNLPPNANLNI